MSAPQLAVFVAFGDEFKRVRAAMAKKDVLSATRVRGELGGVLVDLVQTGIGSEAALKVASQILDEIKYKGCLVLGYCGGLSPRLHVNDVVLASLVLSNKTKFELDKKLNASLGKALVAEGVAYKDVPLITQADIIESQEQRLELFKKTKAEAVDMEAFEIVKLARGKNIPAFVLKAVVDDIHADLPELNKSFKKAGENGVKEELAKVAKTQKNAHKTFTKNMKSGGEVLQKAAPLAASFIDTYWSQNL
ncbi:MAG: hypothetical protein IPM57_06770 [Oligoflexia bacterium]|nr:hypothetical protein [Oligoflexia bacterium]